MQVWLARVTELLAPSVDRLDQLPERAALIFNYDAKAALAAPDNAEVLAWPNTDAVLRQIHGQDTGRRIGESRETHSRMLQAAGQRSESGDRSQG